MKVALETFLRSISTELHKSAAGSKDYNYELLPSRLGRRGCAETLLLDMPELSLDCARSVTLPPSSAPRSASLSEKLAAIGTIADSKTGDAVSRAVQKARHHFTEPEVAELTALLGKVDGGEDLIDRVRYADRVRETKAAPLTTEPLRGATANDWLSLADEFKTAVTEGSLPGGVANPYQGRASHVCKLARLIYVYWLEEAGLYWAVERIADRFENGIHDDTRPLRGLHLSTPSVSTRATALLKAYISLRRRDQLSPLSERWKQYLMQYGFRPAIARAWPRLDVGDARSRFAPALHTWLRETTIYYRRLENLQINPDVTSSKAAAEELSRQIAEGGENLGDQPYAAELRPEVNLMRLILGHPDIHGRLGGRPGTSTLMSQWEQSLDVVAGSYGWQRASIEHYRQLAECGELLVLVLSLLPFAQMAEGPYRAFLELIKHHVMRYVISYAVVAQVDLRQVADPRVPADVLSVLPPPRVPPLRGQWTDQRAGTLAAEAAVAR